MRRPQANDRIKLFGQELYTDLAEEAATGERQRLNFNFHPTLADTPHRFLNVQLRDTYVTPHRHLNPPKAESFVVLKGSVLFFTFTDEGDIEHLYRLGDGDSDAHYQGIDLAPGVWHTLMPEEESAVIYEVKPGPYDPNEDKQFASWAPAEGSDETADYSRSLRERAEGLLD